MTIDYNDRRFRAASNSANGEVGSETLFHYHQKGDIVWGEYSNGGIVFGTLIAKVLNDGSLDMRYQHVSSEGALMTGNCFSKPEILPDGRIRLYESWRWTCGDESSGESVLEEIGENEVLRK